MNDLPKLPEFNHNWTDALRLTWLTAYSHCYASHARSPAMVCTVPLRTFPETSTEVVFEGWANVYEDDGECILHRTKNQADMAIYRKGKTICVRVVRIEEK